MEVLITLMFIGGGFAEIPARLQPYEFCDDKAQEYITYIKNPDYEEGNGQIWISFAKAVIGNFKLGDKTPKTCKNLYKHLVEKGYYASINNKRNREEDR